LFQDIPLEVFQERTGIGQRDLVVPWSDANTIVSLRDIKEVITVQLMSDTYLEMLLHSVTLAGDSKVKPYAGCEISPFAFDAGMLRISQTFVERAKYQAIMEGFEGIFKSFKSLNGIAKLPAVIVLGKTENGSMAVAHYVPPIIEWFDNRFNLVDGTHRSFIVHRVGTYINGIAVKGVKVPFPCRTLRWSKVNVVDAKPLPEDRHVDLKRDLFRDLKFIGIDG
jgi:hypothetical protein